MSNKPPGFWYLFEWGIDHIEKQRESSEQKQRDMLARAKRDEAVAYQRAKDSRAALVAYIDRLMGDEPEQPNYFRGYHWNPYSLRYDIEE